jgi:hypothetical protein
MKENQSNRRKFLQDASRISSLALMPILPQLVKGGTVLFESKQSKQEERFLAPRLKFGVIGINHGHIYSMVNSIVRGGGEFVSFYA